MKTKVLSVIAAASLAMASFAALAVTASAAETVDLSALAGHYTAQDGDTLTGTLGGDYKITIADGARVTLKDAVIDREVDEEDKNYSWAGITPLGDATIVLEGDNTVKGFYKYYPGIYAAVDKTLTIQGSGSLTADSNGFGAGIGGGYEMNCGSIVIESGSINATGGGHAAGIGGGAGGSCGNITIIGGAVNATGVYQAAGIGSGEGASCGDIKIIGGTVNATGGSRAAGIGSGDGGSCDNITIIGGAVNATGGEYAAGIGRGLGGSCGDITISGGTVNATGGEDAAGIGIGRGGSCGDITITESATSVTARKGKGARYSIGVGKGESDSTVTICGVKTGNISKSPYTYGVTGEVTRTAVNNEGDDDGATAFITVLKKSGAGKTTIRSVTWDVTSPAKGKSKSFTASDDLPVVTFNGDGAEVKIALAVDGLYDPDASADVTVQ